MSTEPSAAILTAHVNRKVFTDEFMEWLPLNLHVYAAFEREALAIARRGIHHYSARTIIEVLRHHSALHQAGGGAWKLCDRKTPYLARLFALLNPAHAAMFEFREAKAVRRERAAA